MGSGLKFKGFAPLKKTNLIDHNFDPFDLSFQLNDASTFRLIIRKSP